MSELSWEEKQDKDPWSLVGRLKDKIDFLERDLAAARAEIDKTYGAWCGRDYMHLPLCEAVGKAMEAARAECAELRGKLDRASECVSKMLMHLGGNAINTERGEGKEQI